MLGHSHIKGGFFYVRKKLHFRLWGRYEKSSFEYFSFCAISKVIENPRGSFYHFFLLSLPSSYNIHSRKLGQRREEGCVLPLLP